MEESSIALSGTEYLDFLKKKNTLEDSKK
jgi:hypothetical protein